MKSVSVLWGLICSVSSVDQERNNISLFNVVEQINILPSEFSSDDEKQIVKKFPHEVVMLWRRTMNTDLDRDDIDVDISIELVDPKGTILRQMAVPLQIATGSRRTRLRIRTDSLNITVPGDYVYKISVFEGDGGSVSVFEIPFDVTAKQS